MGVSPPFDSIATTLRARRAHWGTKAGTLVWVPEPPARGDAARARQLAAGVWLLAGHLVEAGQAARAIPRDAAAQLAPPSPWDAQAPDPAWAQALHGHLWLDDFGASRDAAVRARLRSWVWDWIARHGKGSGPGWAPGIVARRALRWIAHGIGLLEGASPAEGTAFLRALAAHARYLERHWEQSAPGLERIEVLAARVHAGLGLEGGDPARAIADLGRSAERLIDAQGGIPGRDPEELLAIAGLLAWVRRIVEEAGISADPGHLAALARAISGLRGLRHADGTLPRFHGGTGGRVAEIDALLGPGPGLVATGTPCGILRRVAGGAALMIDAEAPPPGGRAPLGLEFSAQGCALIVSGVAAPSSLRIAGVDPGAGSVELQASRDAAGDWAIGQASGWLAGIGLVHERRVFLAADGARLAGEDTVLAPDGPARGRLVARLGREAHFTLAFHIDADVAVRPALAGRAAVLTPPQGAPWMLRADGVALEIAASALRVPGRLHPRATKQVVVSGVLAEYWGRVGWSLDRLDRSPGAPTAFAR